jgi:hypothetical protein
MARVSPGVSHYTGALLARVVDGHPYLDTGHVVLISHPGRNNPREDRAGPAPVHPYIVQIGRDRLFEMWEFIGFRVRLHNAVVAQSRLEQRRTRRKEGGGKREEEGGEERGGRNGGDDGGGGGWRRKRKRKTRTRVCTQSLPLPLPLPLPLTPLSLTLRRMFCPVRFCNFVEEFKMWVSPTSRPAQRKSSQP